MLGGWLHQHTYHVATKAVRAERRRQSREREAVEMNTLQDNSEANLRMVAPISPWGVRWPGGAEGCFRVRGSKLPRNDAFVLSGIIRFDHGSTESRLCAGAQHRPQKIAQRRLPATQRFDYPETPLVPLVLPQRPAIDYPSHGSKTGSP